MADTNIGTLRRASGLMRTIAAVVLVTFTSVTLSPSVQAMQQHASQQETKREIAADERDNVGRQLSKAKDQLRLLADKAAPATSGRPTADQRRAAKDALRAWRAEYRVLKSKVQDEFDATGQLLERRRLPDVIKQRHAEAVATFRSESAALESDIDAALDATDDATTKAKAQAAFERLDKAQLQRSQQEFDPNNLPNSSLQGDSARKPKLTPEAFQAALLLSDPSVRLAQASGFDFSQLLGASNPSFLAATTEVVLTPDIQAKADELNRNPVEIYNWVRNNIHWQPTWGAIQDASHTLSSQRGNAFDIASLTVALLRASGIPARYVHGTIDVPEDKFRNWAGGFQHIEAAMDFASAGGIPLGAVTSAGRITKVRMEHIWVEAAIDFHPSRGVKNLAADSWVAMDPSFKQVQLLRGIDTAQISGLNSEQITQSFFASATVNESEGWGTGFDTTILRTAHLQIREGLNEYVEQNLPNATVGDVFGGRRIVPQNAPVLATSLGNRIVAAGVRYASVPTSLQQQITFAFGKSLDGEPLNPRTFAWAQVNNRQVILSFRPATAADEAALQSLLPEGTITDLSQIPTSIPAYLIRVVPELKLDGATVMSGPSMTLGTEVNFVFNPRFATIGVKPFSYKVPAGAYLAVAVLGGSINQQSLANARARYDETRTIVESGNPFQLATLTRERVLGDLFQAGLLGYYAQYVTFGHLFGLKQGGYHQLAAGVGSYGYEPKVDFFFGVPRRLLTGSFAMNIPIVNVVGKDALLGQGRREFTLQLGVLSSVLEHAVPEQMFSSPTQPAEAISAVKALSKASAAGQRIYQITPANQSAALPLVRHDQATMAEIRAALATGKIVLTHTSAVSVPGWTGAGYVIMDPDTGSAAWKIGGGQNGGLLGLLAGAGAGLFAGIAIGLLITQLAPLLAFVLVLGVIITLFGLYLEVLNFQGADSDFRKCWQAGLEAGLAIAAALLAGLGGLLLIPIVLLLETGFAFFTGDLEEIFACIRGQ